MNSMTLETKERYNQLFDYYQLLFTEKQRKHFIDYFQNDFTFNEIADENFISKAAVYDSINNVLSQLDELEKKLNIFSKSIRAKAAITLFKENKCDKNKFIKIIEECF